MTRDYNKKNNIESQQETWFTWLFIIMLCLSIIAIWLIPNEILVRWSMWWNNIS